MARVGISTNWLWCNDNSHKERSKPSNAPTGISAIGLFDISMRYNPDYEQNIFTQITIKTIIESERCKNLNGWTT